MVPRGNFDLENNSTSSYADARAAVPLTCCRRSRRRRRVWLNGMQSTCVMQPLPLTPLQSSPINYRAPCHVISYSDAVSSLSRLLSAPNLSASFAVQCCCQFMSQKRHEVANTLSRRCSSQFICHQSCPISILTHSSVICSHFCSV